MELSAKNRVRAKVAAVLILLGIVLMLLGAEMGGILLAFGGVMAVSLAIIEGVPWAAGGIARTSEPDWEGEWLVTEGGRSRIRYFLDANRTPWFVAGDVCNAIEARPPVDGAKRWGGAALHQIGELQFFSGADVQTYLIPLAIHDHEANRLLLNIRNNVLRKLEKEQEDKKRFDKT